MRDNIKKILLSEQEIATICQDMGKQLTKDYAGTDLIVIGLLKGCNPFLADLVRHMDIPLEIQYMSVSSYHGGIKTSGDVQIKMDLTTSIKNRDVLLVEDIVDTGNTIVTIMDFLKHRGAKSIKLATLLDKPEGRLRECHPDYIGKTIPKEFVVGYGLDYEELYRNLPFVGVLKEEVYTKKGETHE